MKYNVEDIRCFYGKVQTIEANSPLEAAKKAYPNYKITRNYGGIGDIVVGRYTSQYWGGEDIELMFMLLRVQRNNLCTLRVLGVNSNLLKKRGKNQ